MTEGLSKVAAHLLPPRLPGASSQTNSGTTSRIHLIGLVGNTACNLFLLRRRLFGFARVRGTLSASMAI